MFRRKIRVFTLALALGLTMAGAARAGDQHGDGWGNDGWGNNAQQGDSDRAESTAATASGGDDSKNCNGALQTFRNGSLFSKGSYVNTGTIRVVLSGSGKSARARVVVTEAGRTTSAWFSFRNQPNSTRIVLEEEGFNVATRPIQRVLTLNLNSTGGITGGEVFRTGTVSRAGVFGQLRQRFTCD